MRENSYVHPKNIVIVTGDRDSYRLQGHTQQELHVVRLYDEYCFREYRDINSMLGRMTNVRYVPDVRVYH